MRGSIQPPAHRSSYGPRPAALPVVESFGDSDAEHRYVNRPCYEFNSRLGLTANDRHCTHCRHYLTPRCPEIDEFLDDVDDLSPE